MITFNTLITKNYNLGVEIISGDKGNLLRMLGGEINI